ncbi:hypothetical protein EVAR_33944_1 [Eumeta japonica]|uniref:Uncharacterized protein n=1 Tax=Eumeta variegata TaxID=151549 RepID=A0A4C1VW05_EUMVA|nr:hypothetical protein EVAR_33944_1 [Eumeta japonica]
MGEGIYKVGPKKSLETPALLHRNVTFECKLQIPVRTRRVWRSKQPHTSVFKIAIFYAIDERIMQSSLELRRHSRRSTPLRRPRTPPRAETTASVRGRCERIIFVLINKM